MAQIDFSLQNRIPDGNGKLLVGDLSPTDGSYSTEQQYLEWMKGKILYSGYLYNGDFYKESAHTNVISKVDGAIYVDLSDGTNLSLYYCDNTTYKALTEEAQVQAIRTELANGTLVPLKATQDSLGNQIDTTYAKKADLLDGTIVVKEAEIATKDEDGNNIKATYETKAEDSRLKDAIDANSNRISNLEQEHGGYVTVNYRGTNAVPTGKAKYGLVESIVGKSRAWNQKEPEDKRSVTVPQNTTTTYPFAELDWIENHVYLVFYKQEITYTSISRNTFTVKIGGATRLYESTSEDHNLSAGQYYWKFTANGSGNASIGIWASEAVSGKTYSGITVRDLTLIFPEGVPSTIAECVQKCPDILTYDAYGSSIVDTTVSGVKSVGFNRLDLASYMQTLGVSKVGDYYVETANNLSNLTYNNPFPVDWELNTRYSFRLTGYCASGLSAFTLVVYYTDGTTETVVVLNGQSLTTATGTSASGKTISKVLTSYGSGGVNNFYLKSLTISIGTDTTKDAEYMEETLTLPTSVTLRSAGSVAEVYDLETGEVTHPIADETITVASIYTRSGNTSVKFAVFQTTNAWDPDGPAGGDAMWKHGKVVGTSFDDVTTTNVLLVYASNSHQLAISVPYSYSKSDAEALLNGEHVRFVLATPLEPTNIGATINNTILTEGGGTINTIQTQTPVIDNCMDVGYLAL